MFDFDDDDTNYAAESSVSAWELAGEAMGQMAAGSHSALFWCPRCRGSNRMMVTERLNGVAAWYLCTGCGAEMKAEEL